MLNLVKEQYIQCMLSSWSDGQFVRQILCLGKCPWENTFRWSVFPFWCILISQIFAYITDKSKSLISNIVWVWHLKFLLWCADSKCNTEDNYINPLIYKYIWSTALQVFLYLCFDRPGTAVSNYRVCHETVTMQDKAYRLPLQIVYAQAKVRL